MKTNPDELSQLTSLKEYQLYPAFFQPNIFWPVERAASGHRWLQGASDLALRRLLATVDPKILLVFGCPQEELRRLDEVWCLVGPSCVSCVSYIHISMEVHAYIYLDD